MEHRASRYRYNTGRRGSSVLEFAHKHVGSPLSAAEQKLIQHLLTLCVNTLEHIAPKLRASLPAGHSADSQRPFLLLG